MQNAEHAAECTVLRQQTRRRNVDFVSLALRCQLLVHVVHARDPRLVYENVALKWVEHCVHHNQPTVLLDYWLESFPEQ